MPPSRTLQLCLNQRHPARGMPHPSHVRQPVTLGPDSIDLDGPIDTTHEGEGAVKTSSEMEMLRNNA